MSEPVCVVVGIGPKNGEAFARRFATAGYKIALLSRSTKLSEPLARELGGRAYACDASDAPALAQTFAKIGDELGPPEVLVYNAGSGTWKDFEDTSVEDLERAFRINTTGLLVAGQAVVPGMRARKRGAIIVVGATASLRGKPMTTSFAAGKAAQRSLAQSMARRLWPEGIHVALLIVDGAIGDAGVDNDGKRLDPQAIAETAYQLTQQPSSAWSFELDLRPRAEPW